VIKLQAMFARLTSLLGAVRISLLARDITAFATRKAKTNKVMPYKCVITVHRLLEQFMTLVGHGSTAQQYEAGSRGLKCADELVAFAFCRSSPFEGVVEDQ